MKLAIPLLGAALALGSLPAVAGSLTIDLGPSAANPASPQMGDKLMFHTTIRNSGDRAIEGLIAWISLLEVDQGHEQPVDLEDWSAQKAVSVASLAPGDAVETAWPMRLIQSGDYRVVVSAASRNGAELTPSPFADFTVRSKPVVESRRVLPVALGIPALIGATFLFRRRRSA
jgi:hypothetical protein